MSLPKRMPDFPDVPTFAEIGHPGCHHDAVVGMDGAGGLPQPAIARLTQELQAISKDDVVRERLKATFVQMDFAGPDEFAKRIEAETVFYGGIIRAANIKLNP